MTSQRPLARAGVKSRVSRAVRRTVRVPGWKTGVATLRWLRSRGQPRVLVLGYHRIADPATDRRGMAVSTSCFEQQMRVLADLAQPIRLQDLESSLLRKEGTSAGVAVTFDDGYADNLRTAIPILEKFGIPATFFVVSGYLGREFWWDELDRLDAKDDRAAIDMDLSAAPDDQRRRILNGLARRARWCSPAPLHRALTADELRRAAGSSLIEIGAHGATHRSLPGLSIAEQRREVDGSRRLLEAIVDGPIQSFSYPHGAVTRSTASMVKHAGFSVACCSTPDVVTLRTDVLAVPRFWIPNWGAQRFEHFLRRWLLD